MALPRWFRRERRLSFAFQLACMVLIVLAQFIREVIQLKDGLGWDGVMYGEMATHFRTLLTNPPFPEVHFVQRILPSWLVGWGLNFFERSHATENLVLGFRILNSLSALAAWGFFRNIASLLRMSARTEALAFSACFLTYYFLACYPYHPLTTDPMAFLFGLASFSFYLRGNMVLLAITTFLCGFTWPSGFLTGLFLIAFPRGTRIEIPARFIASFEKLLLLGAAAVYFALYWSWLVVDRAEAHGAAKINRTLLEISALVVFGYVAIIVRSFARSYAGATSRGIQGRPVFTGIRWRAMAMALALYALHDWLVTSMAPHSGRTGTSYLREFLVNGLVNPGHFISSAFIFFGPIVVWTWLRSDILFKRAREVGLGLQLALGISFAFLINAESRHLIYHLPFFFVLAIASIPNDVRARLVAGLVALQVVASHFWVNLSIPWEQRQDFLKWPEQRYMMNYGPWLNQSMYLVGLAGAVATFVLFRQACRKRLR